MDSNLLQTKLITPRRIVTVVALAVLAVSLSACGFARTIDPVASAATKTANAGGMKATLDIDVTDTNAQKTYSVAANGAFDQDQGELTMDLSSALGSAGIPAGTLKLVTLQENGDAVIYVNYPPLTKRIPGGRPWVRLDLQKAGAAAGANLDQLLNQVNQSPAQILDLLRANADLKQVGSETIDGTATTRYEGSIDLAKAAKLQGAASELVQRLAAAGAPTTLPVEVWVGSDGLVRRLRLTESINAGGHAGSAVVTLGMSDFGTPVAVTAPPASDVFDATMFAQLAAKAQHWSQSGSSNP